MSRALLSIDSARQAREIRRAREAEAQVRSWRRTWRRVYAECIGLALLGYVLYGVSFAVRSGEQADLIVAASFFVSYALPFFRLIFFYARHSDQF